MTEGVSVSEGYQRWLRNPPLIVLRCLQSHVSSASANHRPPPPPPIQTPSHGRDPPAHGMAALAGKP
ncbi:hypothetical protein Nepgr_019187 [Nepenthes gracilis]|uniref:Uncharacterized protein n=1 Tax=Nepenthes gracilis TaxID=150966 RepID=A0AAD3SWH3_NEPGR|nr:hypothetical protein Nepgr_019187 [Nepenthes gracilis]